jgi:glutamate racemase
MISGIDYLVLGCSHYPYIKHILEELLPKNVRIIDSGTAVARQTLAVLQQNNFLNESGDLGVHKLYSNADISTLQQLVGPVENASIEHLDF